jgi:hypothetical protein
VEEIQIDWLVVLMAAVLKLAISSLWYSKWLFGKTWLKLSKLPEKGVHGPWSIFYSFLVALVIAFFLAFFEGYLGVTTVSDGMFVGFCAWLGFVVTTQISQVIWSGRSWQLFLIESSSKLLSYLVMGGIIGA